MATSQQPTPQGQPYVVDFTQSINLDNVAEKVYPFDDGVAPHLTNTGILRDDGVTNLYETARDDSVAYTGTWYAPDGSRVNIGADGIYVNDRLVSSDPVVQAVVETKIVTCLDLSISSTGTILALVERVGVNASRVDVVEMDYSTGDTLNTRTLPSSYGANGPYFLCLVKTPQMTFANTAVAHVVFSAGNINVAYIDSSLVSYTVLTTPATSSFMDGISAFGNGGTVVIGGIAVSGAASSSYRNNAPNNYAAWSNVGSGSYSHLEPTRAIPTYTTMASMDILATPSTLRTSATSIFGAILGISDVGVFTSTPSTAAGLNINAGSFYSGFGYASGLYTSAAATVLSPYHVRHNTGITVTNRDLTVTPYAVKPDSFQFSTYSATIVSGKIAQVGVGYSPVCDYGYPSNKNAIVKWSTSASVDEYFLTIPGKETVQIVKVSASNFRLYAIAPNLVTFADANGTIINTSLYQVETNKAMMPRAFISDMLLTGTKSLAWQSTGKYSNSPDMGQINNVAGYSSGVYYDGVSNLFEFYQSSTSSGTLFSVGAFRNDDFLATDNTVAYVPNPNITPPAISEFRGGGISMVLESSLQTVNFATAYGFAQYYNGYTLANLYPIQYQFFNIFGQLYGFDGTKIYRMPVNGATAGTPEQVALASGLVFITNSPTAAWFWSSFDNSVYSFDGGQSVQKWQEMTGVGTVVSGAYSVLESSLYLQLSDDTTLVFRDEKASQLANAYTSQTIYATDGGTYFVNDDTPTQSKKWSYFAGTGTPIALTWQSGFYGFGRNQWSRISFVVFTLKVADSATTDITVNYRWLTSTDNGTETKTFTGGSYSESSTGYVRLQYNPTNPLVYGASVGISCTKKVTLYECVVYYTDGGVAQVPNLGP